MDDIILNDDIKKRIRFLREYKCQEDGCYNFRESGVIYCVNHLHGFPRKMSNEDIMMLQKTDLICVCEDASMDRNGNCRECGAEKMD